MHAFTPAALERHAAGAGFTGVRVRGEELLANWFGWFNRTVEASARHEDIPHAWFQYAYHGYLALQKVDRAVLKTAAARGRLLQPDGDRPQAGARGLRPDAATTAGVISRMLPASTRGEGRRRRLSALQRPHLHRRLLELRDREA